MNIDKKKMRKILYIYIAVMLLLALFSKTIYNFSLPKVSVVMPTSGKLVKNLEAYGEVKFAQTYDVFSTKSGQIEEIYVKKNDKLASNEIVAKIKETSSEDKTLEMEFAIQKIKHNIEALIIEKSSLEREINDLSMVPENKNITDKSLLLELENIEATISNQEKALTSAKILYEAGGISKAEYDKTAEELRTLQNTKEQKQAQIENHKEENQKEFEEKEKLRVATFNQETDSLAKTMLAIKAAELDLQKAELDLSKSKENIVDENILKCSRNGIVVALEKQESSFITQGEKVATIGILDDSFVTEISCTKSEGKFITLGDKVNISLAGTLTKAVAVVNEIEPDGDNLKIKLSFQSTAFNGGEYVKVNFNKQTEKYDVLVPNEAVVNEGFHNYIWVVRSTYGSLGTEYYAVRIKILIADMDESNTAISKGIDYIQPIVMNKNKDLSMNGRVIQMD